MADRIGIVNKFKQLQNQIGRAALNSFYPSDVELYLCAFELVSNNKTEAYFVFPIQPSSIQKIEPTRTNVKVSISGVTVLRNSSFIPQEISIKGNFGRRFKILTGLEGVGFGASLSKDNGLIFDTPSFSTSIKSGYGATKLLQKIIRDSQKLDSIGKPKRLYFYNMALGESYLVTIPPSGISFTQTEDQNMIWQYSVTMTILAHLKDVSGIEIESSNKNIISKGVIQKGINIVANEVKLLLS